MSIVADLRCVIILLVLVGALKLSISDPVLQCDLLLYRLYLLYIVKHTNLSKIACTKCNRHLCEYIVAFIEIVLRTILISFLFVSNGF